jgi:tetratricopeptide (TPR) repeat protein
VKVFQDPNVVLPISVAGTSPRVASDKGTERHYQDSERVLSIEARGKPHCKYCGKPLTLRQRISGAAFCSSAHGEIYRQKRVQKMGELLGKNDRTHQGHTRAMIAMPVHALMEVSGKMPSTWPDIVIPSPVHPIVSLAKWSAGGLRPSGLGPLPVSLYTAADEECCSRACIGPIEADSRQNLLREFSFVHSRGMPWATSATLPVVPFDAEVILAGKTIGLALRNETACWSGPGSVATNPRPSRVADYFPQDPLDLARSVVTGTGRPVTEAEPILRVASVRKPSGCYSIIPDEASDTGHAIPHYNYPQPATLVPAATRRETIRSVQVENGEVRPLPFGPRISFPAERLSTDWLEMACRSAEDSQSRVAEEAASLLAQRKPEHALRALQLAAASGTSSVEIEAAQGDIQFSLERFEEALISYRNAAALEPRNAFVLLSAATCMRKLGHWQEANQRYAAALALAPDLFDARIGVAFCHVHRGRPNLAYHAFERCLQAKPDSYPALFGRALALQLTNREQEAASVYATILEMDSQSEEVLGNLVGLALQREDSPLARDYAERLRAIRADSVVALEGLAACDFLDGDFASAAAQCATLTPFVPDSFEAWFNLAVANHRMGRLDEAIQAYETALRLRPEESQAWSNLGQVWHKLGNVTKAEHAYERSLAACA